MKIYRLPLFFLVCLTLAACALRAQENAKDLPSTEEQIRQYLLGLTDRLERLNQQTDELNAHFNAELDGEIYQAQQKIINAQYALLGVYDILENVEHYEGDVEQPFEEARGLLDETSEVILETQKTLNEDRRRSVGALICLEETQSLIYSTYGAIREAEEILALDNYITDVQNDRLEEFKTLIVETHASMIQSEIALSQTPEKELSFEESLLQTQKYVRDIAETLKSVSSKATTFNPMDIQQKIFETRLILIRTQQHVIDDAIGMPFQVRKSLAETLAQVKEVQDLLLEGREFMGLDHYDQTQQFVDMAHQSLIKIEAKVASQIMTLPVNEEIYNTPEIAEETGVTQEHVVQVIGSLVKTQDELSKMLNMLPKMQAEKTKILELQAESQRLLLENMDEREDIREALLKTKGLLNETQYYIASTEHLIKQFPDSVITLRQYYDQYEVLLERTNLSIEATQKLIKQSEKILLLSVTVYFENKGDRLTEASMKKLSELETLMKENKEHTCRVIRYVGQEGNASFDEELSRRRMKQALDFLLDKGMLSTNFTIENRVINTDYFEDDSNGSNGLDWEFVGAPVEFEVYK